MTREELTRVFEDNQRYRFHKADLEMGDSDYHTAAQFYLAELEEDPLVSQTVTAIYLAQES